MAATRREQLAAVLEAGGDSPAITQSGDHTRASEDNAEGGFPFAVLQGSGVVDPPTFETRVKSDGDKSKKTEKEPPKRAGTASERQLAEIAEGITEKADQVAVIIAGITPVTSVYLAENSPRAITALVAIAKRRPGMLKALSKVADGVDAIEVGKFVLGILTALQVDFGRIPADSLPARVTGVTAVVDEHLSPEGAPNPAVMFQAPQYVPV